MQQILPEIRLGRPNPHRPKGETLMGDPKTVENGLDRIIGTRIALARTDLGRGAEEMADYAGYSVNSIEFLENGGYGPRRPLKLALMADFLGIQPEFFVQPIQESEFHANQLFLSPEQKTEIIDQITLLAEKLDKQLQLLPTPDIRYNYRRANDAINGLVYPPDPRQQNLFSDDVIAALEVLPEAPARAVALAPPAQPAVGGVREQLSVLRQQRQALWQQVIAVDNEIARLMEASEG